MIKKTENFQNIISEYSDSSTSRNLFNFVYYLRPIIYLFIMFFFPKIGLIINTILIVYLLYYMYILFKEPGAMIFTIFFIPLLIIVTILEIILLFIVGYSGKKAESKDND